jgi:hypothetical protein
MDGFHDAGSDGTARVETAIWMDRDHRPCPALLAERIVNKYTNDVERGV